MAFRAVVGPGFQFLGQIDLAGRIGARLVMGVAVAAPVAQLLQQAGGRIAQVHGHRVGRRFPHMGHGSVERLVGGVALGHPGQVKHRLGDGQLTFGGAQPLVGIPGAQGHLQGSGVRIADVLAGHAHQAAGDVQRVAAAIQHAAAPVQGGIRGAAAHGLVQGGDLIVELIPALVEAPPAASRGLRHQAFLDLALGQLGNGLQQIQQPPSIAVRQVDQQLGGGIGQGDPQGCGGPFKDLLERRLVQGFQDMHSGPGKQRRVHLEGRIFGGGTDEGDGALLHMRQEGILLRLVEAMHLIHEQHRALPQPLRGLSGLHRLAHIAHAAQDGAQGNPAPAGPLRQQLGQGGLAGTGRPPKDHGVNAALGDQPAQRRIVAQQMRLPGEVGDGRRPQPVGQGPGLVGGEAGRRSGWVAKRLIHEPSAFSASIRKRAAQPVRGKAPG